MFEVSFPGLGIGPFEINSTAFTIFGHPVAWYGIIIACGMICAFLYGLSRAKIEGVKSDDIIDMTLFLIIAGIVGARLYYVIFKLDDFIATGGSFFQNLGSTLYNIVAVWNGGLAIFGGIIAGFFTALVVARVKKIYFPVILDILGPSVILAQGIGRWGNFTNGEAYGSETDAFIRMGLTKYSGGGAFSNYFEVHPTFLYESLWCILGFVLMTVFYKKKKFNGQIFYFYMIWYGAGRAVIEGLRTDSLYLFSTGIRVSQLFAVLVCIAGIALTVFFGAKKKKEQLKNA